MKMTWVAGLVVLFGAAMGFSGCGGPSIGDACQYQCDCTKDCTPKQEAVCESQGAAQQTLADKADCTSEFNDKVSCASNATCKDARIQESDCAAEIDALHQCLDDAGFGDDTGFDSGGDTVSGGGGTGDDNICNSALQHDSSCTNSTDTTIPDSECTGQVECESKCILAASCQALLGQDTQGAQTFGNCVNACK